MIRRKLLERLYIKKKKSLQEIADALNFSVHKIKYWVDKYKIKTRTISEAVYIKNNPRGDPFKFNEPENIEDAKLFGLGIGLYWGEGTKRSRHSVKLGNSDPAVIKSFIKFLVKTFGVKKSDMRFSLQLFSDINEREALNFWSQKIKISKAQFTKTTITKTGSIGTYRYKSKYGVLSLHYHNRKLRDALIALLPISQIDYYIKR